jgi:hypothetical protein
MQGFATAITNSSFSISPKKKEVGAKVDCADRRGWLSARPGSKCQRVII